MAGRVRHFARDESVRHQELGMTRDSRGVSPSREPRESHTAPSGLPATRSGDIFSILGVKGGKIQENWEKKCAFRIFVTERIRQGGGSAKN